MPFYTYILKSEKDGRYYFGQTQDISKRIVYHNTGKSRYTRSFIPWKIFYFKTCDTRAEAMRFEKMLKNLHSKSRVLDFINKHGFESPQVSG